MSNTKIRKGKRRWFSILAPKMFNEQEIGETFVYETEQIPEKHLTVNLMTLTNNPKKQNMSVFLKVSELKEGIARTKTLGVEMSQSASKRLVRRGRSKVADSFRAKTKGGQIVRVKPLIMTKTRCDKETQSAIRLKTRELLRETLLKYSFTTIINDIVNNRLQRHLKDQLSSVFPVRGADIRYIRFEQTTLDGDEAVEQTEYAERPRREKQPEKAPEGLAGLKDELDEAIAAEKIEIEEKETPKTKKKAAKKVVDEDDEDDE